MEPEPFTEEELIHFMVWNKNGQTESDAIEVFCTDAKNAAETWVESEIYENGVCRDRIYDVLVKGSSDDAIEFSVYVAIDPRAHGEHFVFRPEINGFEDISNDVGYRLVVADTFENAAAFFCDEAARQSESLKEKILCDGVFVKVNRVCRYGNADEIVNGMMIMGDEKDLKEYDESLDLQSKEVFVHGVNKLKLIVNNIEWDSICGRPYFE